MTIIKALKVRLYPNRTQQCQMDTTLDCCRFVYNHMLARNEKVYKRRGEHLSYNNMQNLMSVMKQYLPWLKEADSQALKYSCRQVDNAYQKFFKEHTGYPKFKIKRGRQSYTTTHGNSTHIDLDKRKIKLPLLGWVRCRGLRDIGTEYIIKRATVSRETDSNYYVSMCYQIDVDIQPIPSSNNIIGLDYKSHGLYVDSNGNIPKFQRYFRENQAKLAKEQRKLAKKKGNKKGEKKSENWKKQNKKVAKLQRKIANQRKDALHKLSKQMADEYDGVGVEDLDLRNLSQNLNLGKSTYDNGFGDFRNMIDYKMKWQGKTGLIKVDKHFPSSQLCSCCGFKNPEVKDLSVRERTCPCCGEKHDRDANAAVNIRNEAMRIITEKQVA